MLQDLHGKPMLARQIERVKRCKRVDKIVVATSWDVEDDAVVSVAYHAGLDFHRGSLDDVFSRVYTSAVKWGADHIVRLTGDCPLTDPGIIDECIDLHLTGMDYTSNVEPCTYPDGLDVEVFTFAALEAAHKAMTDAREHVTTLFRRPLRWKIGRLTHAPSLAHLRWTVDYPADLDKVRRVYANLYDKNPAFSWLDVLEWEEKHGSSTQQVVS